MLDSKLKDEEYLINRTFEEIKIGDFAEISHQLLQKDIELFAIMSGDINPAHVDPEYAKSDMFHQIVAHGMWGGSLISTVLGTKLPGPGTIYLSQTLKFLHPILLNDLITARVTVIEKDLNKNKITLDCSCFNQKNETVISGCALVIAPGEKIRRKKVILPEVILREKHI